MFTLQQAPGRPGHFALKPALVWLTATALAAAVIAWLSLVLVAGQLGASTLAVITFTSVNGFCALLGVVVVALVAKHGSFAIAMTYLVASSLRFICNLIVVSVLVVIAVVSVKIVVFALAMAYLPLLAVETILVGLFLWRLQDRPVHSGVSPNNRQAGKSGKAAAIHPTEVHA